MSKKTIVRSAGIISLATLLSRVLGLAREIIFADLFGANFITDAFRVAYSIPYTLRRLLGEGAMSAFLVPVFTEIRSKEGEQAAKEFADNVLTVFSLIVVGIIAIYIAIAPGIIYLMAPGLADNPQAFDLAVFLSRLMIPYMLLMMTSALSMGLLNSYRHFFSPAMAPVVMNLAVIIALLYLCPRMGDTVYLQIQGVAYGVLAGGILQVLVQFPSLIKRGFIYRPRFNFRHPGIKRMLILMGPAVFVIGVVRFNILMDTLMSSFLGEGNISYLNYGERLLQFPLGALGFGISTSILPLLSQYCAEKNNSKYKETLNFAFRLVLVLSIPATLGLVVLASPTVRLIYQHGQFTATDAFYTTRVLLAFLIGLVGFVGIQVVVPAFYSRQDTKTPLKAALVGLVANLFFNLTLMYPLASATKGGASGLARNIPNRN
jgi:putative peptidoglycan lipid II flippase